MGLGMKLTYATTVPLAIISLFNLPVGFSPGDIPAGLAWSVTALGFVGFVVVVALVRGLGWSAPAAETIGVVNLIAAVMAVVGGREGAVIGLLVSAAVVASATVLLFGRHRRSTVAAS